MARLAHFGLAFAAIVVLASTGARADTTHVVAKGQTLGRIAKRYHVSVEDLRDANDLRPGQAIHPGLELTIPDGSGGSKAKGAGGARPKGAQASAGDGRSRDGSRGDADFARRPKHPGVVHLVRGDERFDGQLLGRHGRLNPTSLAGVSKVLHFAPTGGYGTVDHGATDPRSRSVDPRLASLVGMVSDHFGGRPLHVVSGFRPYSPTQYTPHSNHNVGKAIDFAIEGVPNTVLRDFCRQFHDAGVGYYPNSSFVHLDVRAGKAYWIDYAKPGEPPRYDPAHPHHEADEAARDVEAPPPADGAKPNTPDADGGSKTTP